MEVAEMASVFEKKSVGSSLAHRMIAAGEEKAAAMGHVPTCGIRDLGRGGGLGLSVAARPIIPVWLPGKAARAFRAGGPGRSSWPTG
jgi:hypothetical protein